MNVSHMMTCGLKNLTTLEELMMGNNTSGFLWNKWQSLQWLEYGK